MTRTFFLFVFSWRKGKRGEGGEGGMEMGEEGDDIPIATRLSPP